MVTRSALLKVAGKRGTCKYYYLQDLVCNAWNINKYVQHYGACSALLTKRYCVCNFIKSLNGLNGLLTTRFACFSPNESWECFYIHKISDVAVTDHYFTQNVDEKD